MFYFSIIIIIIIVLLIIVIIYPHPFVLVEVFFSVTAVEIGIVAFMSWLPGSLFRITR